jgi:endonuclease/exonuclease/phosphatase family metal-dependent hydrolase
VREGVQVIQHGILADHWDGRYPSDHLPVLAEVEIPSDEKR